MVFFNDFNLHVFGQFQCIDNLGTVIINCTLQSVVVSQLFPPGFPYLAIRKIIFVLFMTILISRFFLECRSYGKFHSAESRLIPAHASCAYDTCDLLHIVQAEAVSPLRIGCKNRVEVVLYLVDGLDIIWIGFEVPHIRRGH